MTELLLCHSQTLLGNSMHGASRALFYMVLDYPMLSPSVLEAMSQVYIQCELEMYLNSNQM